MNYTLLSNSDLSGLTKQYVESSMHLPHCLVVWIFSSPPTFAPIFYNQYSKGPWIFPWGGQKPILLPGRDDSGWDSRGRQFRPLAATARWSRANFLKWQGKPSWIAKICWKIIRYNKIFTSVYICPFPTWLFLLEQLLSTCQELQSVQAVRVEFHRLYIL